MNRIIKLFATVTLLSISLASTAYGGVWKQDDQGWWWQDKDKSYPSATWKWIDSDGDGMAECYYFDENGYLLTGTTAPDGSTINESGEWTQLGIVRQRACNPANANALKLKGEELYYEADQRNSGLSGLDISSNAWMYLSFDYQEIPFFINMQLKYHDMNTPNMEFLSQISTDIPWIESGTSFYTNGWYYVDGMYQKYKMNVGYKDMTDSMVTIEFDSLLDNIQIADVGDGSKILFYTGKIDNPEKYLKDIYEVISPGLFELDYNISQIDGYAIINPEGYLSKETIAFNMDFTEDGETLDVFLTMDINYNNPEKAVSMEFPSTEGYEEIIY